MFETGRRLLDQDWCNKHCDLNLKLRNGVVKSAYYALDYDKMNATQGKISKRRFFLISFNKIKIIKNKILQ